MPPYGLLPLQRTSACMPHGDQWMFSAKCVYSAIERENKLKINIRLPERHFVASHSSRIDCSQKWRYKYKILESVFNVHHAFIYINARNDRPPAVGARIPTPLKKRIGSDDTTEKMHCSACAAIKLNIIILIILWSYGFSGAALAAGRVFCLAVSSLLVYYFNGNSGPFPFDNEPAIVSQERAFEQQERTSNRPSIRCLYIWISFSPNNEWYSLIVFCFSGRRNVKPEMAVTVKIKSNDTAVRVSYSFIRINKWTDSPAYWFQQCVFR